LGGGAAFVHYYVSVLGLLELNVNVAWLCS
jgi:hypothetical protein